MWETINRPNLMIKIPATKGGIPAIREYIAAGININITPIFSLKRYDEVMEAYVSGLVQAIRVGKPISRIASVASFFVSRVDTKVDARLSEDSLLRGKAAIASAKPAYNRFLRFFETPRFMKLQ